MMRRFSKLVCGLAVTGMIAICSNVQAAPLVPGGSIPAPAEPDPIGGSAGTGTPATVAFSAGGPAGYTGTLTSTVITGDVSNPFGGLTFTYQLHNDSTSLSALERMTNIDFTGYLTDVSYQAPAAGVLPTSVDRDATGSTVGWNFSPVGVGLGAIAPGQDSAVLVIQTNAQAFGMVDAGVIDGAGTSVQSFGPVPEPGSMALLAIGSLLSLRRRRA